MSRRWSAWLPRLSFGFTVNISLATCVHKLQNEDTRLFPSYKVYVSPIDDTLSEFYVDEINTYFPVEAKGELKYIDYDTTLVSGEIQQRIGLRVDVLLAFLAVLTIYFAKVAIDGGGFWGLLALAGFALYFILEKRTHVARMLTKIKLMLDPNFVRTMTRKTAGE